MASFFGEVVTGSYRLEGVKPSCVMHCVQAHYIKAFLPRFIDDEDEDLIESFKNNDFVLTEQVVYVVDDMILKKRVKL